MAVVKEIPLGEFQAQVVGKNIKHVHLSVHPPDGQVRISAPLGMPLEAIRLYALSKLEWIQRQRRRIRGQERESPHEFLDRESHYVWGHRYLLRIIEADRAPSVKLDHSTLELSVRPGADVTKRHEVLDAWYREQIRKTIPSLLAKWELILNVKSERVLIQRMKTKWGSCNPAVGYIRLNTELARKPPQCLEYVLVHELAHLIEPSHNARFQGLMDQALPSWRNIRRELNQLPVPHENWSC